jgi:periplasmic divalent cation tolerance protein
MEAEYLVVLIACPKDEAEDLANALIGRRLAACIQTSDITSMYEWKGKVEKEKEVRLVLKTKTAHFEKIEECVRKVMSYETPQIIALPVLKGNKDYLAWIDEVTVS